MSLLGRQFQLFCALSCDNRHTLHFLNDFFGRYKKIILGNELHPNQAQQEHTAVQYFDVINDKVPP